MLKTTKKMLLLLSLTVLLAALPLVVAAIESEDCQGCHSDIDTVGEALLINSAIFDSTVHADQGCPSCHESVTEAHPDDGKAVSKAVCLDCHSEIAEEFSKSSHAGNASCGDCHNPHMVRGLAEVSGYDMNQSCAGCHETEYIVKSHAIWLPQASLHIAKLPCVSCHTGSEEYVIVLYIIQHESDAAFGDFELADYQNLQAVTGSAEVKHLVDLNRDDFISLTELRTFNLNPAYAALRLRGTLTPKEITHSVTIHNNRWDCTFCHASGPEALQTSFLAVPNDDGTYQRLEVERGAVLNALSGTPDFYMMGATRSPVMNVIGILIILGGCLMPLGHGLLRFLTRKNRIAEKVTNPIDKKKVYLQPTPVRIWHWLNAFGIVTLCVTGAQIRFPEYVHLFSSYKASILLHNTAGFVVAFSFSIWFFYYTLVARNMGKLYIPKMDDLQNGLLRQAKYYLLTYFLGWKNPHHPTPEDKFNPLQKSAYLAIMFVLMPLVCLTGIFLTNVEPLRGFIFMLGSLKLLVGLHFLLACSLCAFLFTHVYLATLGHTPLEHFKPMWTGWEVESDEHAQETKAAEKAKLAA